MSRANDKVIGGLAVCDFLTALFLESPKESHTKQEVLRLLELVREDFEGAVQVELVRGEESDRKRHEVN